MSSTIEAIAFDDGRGVENMPSIQQPWPGVRATEVTLMSRMTTASPGAAGGANRARLNAPRLSKTIRVGPIPVAEPLPSVQ